MYCKLLKDEACARDGGEYSPAAVREYLCEATPVPRRRGVLLTARPGAQKNEKTPHKKRSRPVDRDLSITSLVFYLVVRSE
ncbi:MAG: hypothetical protein V4717_14305 [Bacteroidota bacterium]